MSSSLKSKTVRALSWSFVETVGMRGLQFAIWIILARLLVPDEFGLMGMLAIFLALAQTFLDSGFGAALIQKQDATHVDSCSIFYCNIVVGLIAAGLLCLAAPWIAGFFHEPILTPLTRFLSLNIVINSFGLIQTTLLVKRIDFKTQTKISLTAVVASGVISVTLAFNGFGVWSLAIQMLCTNLFRTVLLWIFNSWRPSLVFSFTALRPLFAFGSRLLTASLMNTIFQNIYLVVIGRLFSAGILGFYARAKMFQELPTISLSQLVDRVMFPVFSAIQDDTERLKQNMQKALKTLALVNFPLMIGLAVVAKPLVLVLLTDKWAPCIPYLRLLCVAGMLYPLHAINLNVLKAQGRSDRFLQLASIDHALQIVALVITIPWGIEGILWGYIASSIICYGVNTWYTVRMVHYSLREQIRDILPYLLMAGAMGSIAWAFQYLPIPYVTVLLLQVTVGLAVYLLLCNLFRPSAFVEGWAVLTARGSSRVKSRRANSGRRTIVLHKGRLAYKIAHRRWDTRQTYEQE